MGEDFTAEEFAALLAEALQGTSGGRLLILLLRHAKTFAERVLAVLRWKHRQTTPPWAVRRRDFLTGMCGDEQLVAVAASLMGAGKLVFRGTAANTGIRRAIRFVQPAVLTVGDKLPVLP
jgi:hypothetical protein